MDLKIILGFLTFLFISPVLAMANSNYYECPYTSDYSCGQYSGYHNANPTTCTVSVNDIMFERISSQIGPITYCFGDILRANASVSLDNGIDQRATLKLYIDGNFFGTENVNLVGGSNTVTFSDLIDTLNLGAGPHSLKVTADVRCDPDGSQLTEIFNVQDCSPYQFCNPGDIRNRNCECPNYITYEKCRDDGNGWDIVTEPCRNDYMHYSGYSAYIGPCCLSAIVSTPGNLNSGQTASSTVTLSNSDSSGAYTSVNVYVCEIGSTCYNINCNGNNVGSRVFVPGNGATTLTCNANLAKEGSYQLKAIYSGYDGDKVAYSSIFGVSGPASPQCQAQNIESYRCVDDWRQQLYQNSDCSTTWVNLQKCSYGCSDGSTCLPSPNMTDVLKAEASPSSEEKFTGTTSVPENYLFYEPIGFIVIIVLIIVIVVLFYNAIGMRPVRRNRPESF